MSNKRGQWHLLTGLIFGLLIGVIFSLWVLPVRYTDTEPYSLREQDRKTYRELIARVYLVEADTNRALARIGLLKDANPSSVLIAQAQELLGNSGSDQTAQALALLAAAINQPSLVITPIASQGLSDTPLNVTPDPLITPTVFESTPTLTVTRTPAATFTPRPTATMKPTLGAPFVLVENKPVCDPVPPIPLIQVFVEDSSGKPVPGVKVEISQLNGGSEAFFTGFYPEISVGYADYAMTAGMEYALRVGEAGQLVSGLSIPDCNTGGANPVPGSIRLIFKQP
jgi:hypothetical protein